jgi:hypothetical protein
VSEVAAVTSQAHAETWLPADHFALACAPSQPSIRLNLPQSLRQNKTAGLVTLRRSDADGN